MEVLRYLLVSLHDRLPVGDGLINYLYSNGLLKRNDVEELKGKRRDEAIDCLVTQILPFADSATFPVFCKALQMTNAEHALRPIRAVVETIVPHFQGIPPEILASSSVVIIVDISLRESFYREFPAIKDRLFASAAVELIYANLAGFYRNACMSTQNVHALNRKLVIVTGPPVAESHILCNQIANVSKIDRNVIAYHCSQQRAWEQSQPFRSKLGWSVSSTTTTLSQVDKNIYKQSLASGSIPINRYRVMVVGQDGAGKSCLIDSFLDQPFKVQSSSTDGVSIHMAITAAEGKAGQHAWHREKYETAQHLEKYFAAGYVITERRHQELKRSRQTDTTKREADGEEEPWQDDTIKNDTLVKDCKVELGQSEEKLPTKRHKTTADPSEVTPSYATQELDRHIEEIAKDENLPPEQREKLAKYLQSSEYLVSLENLEISSKLLWDLGGQERYLTSHAALMPAESEYTVCMYLLVIDISKPLGNKAESFYRPGGTSDNVPLALSSILYNRDFPRHWFTSICISHPSDTPSPYLGEDLEGVSYPAVLIAATHIDKVAKMPNCEEFLESQNAELDNLIRKLKCVNHIVKNSKNGQWFFRVDNTKSGQTEDSERCEGVKTIASILDSSSKHYWSQRNETLPMPVAWVRFELYLVLWKIGKIMSVETATKLAYRVGIKSDEEAKLALKFLHNLGVIFYFHDVPELDNCVIVDPTWLIKTVSEFVPAKGLEKTKYQFDWENRCCEAGEFSREMVMSMLEKAKVESRDQEPVLDVLRMLDIICDSPEASSSKFFIPCIISRKLTGPSMWEEYSPNEAFPPPIVIFPDKVQTISEAFFFRIVTKCIRKYPKKCDLSRNRCLFRIGSNLVLELLYYDRGACLIVSMTGEGTITRAKKSVAHVAPVVRQFILDSVANAKKRGMNGLKLEFYYQVAECETTSVTNCQLPNNGYLIELPDGEPDDSLFCKSNKYCTDEQLERVRLWYSCTVQEDGFSESQDPYRERLKNMPTREELIDLSDALVTKWKPIARRLTVCDKTIDKIDLNERDARERAYKVLQTWMELRPESASVETLCRALCKEDMQYTAANIFKLQTEILCRFGSN